MPKKKAETPEKENSAKKTTKKAQTATDEVVEEKIVIEKTIEETIDEPVKEEIEEVVASENEDDEETLKSVTVDIISDEESEDSDAQQKFTLSLLSSDLDATDDGEIWNILKSICQTGALLPARIINVTNMSVGKNFGSQLCFVAKLQGIFKNYNVNIPYKAFFTVDERKNIAFEEKDEFSQHRFCNFFLNAYVDIRLLSCTQSKTGDNVSRILVGSRVKALQTIRKKCFDKGFRNSITGNIEKVRENAIISNCKVLRASTAYAFVDVAGVPTIIPRSELSHKFIASASDAYKAGDTVDVLIKKIEINSNNMPKLTCSVKDLTPNNTIPALLRADDPDKLGIRGETIGKVTAIVRNSSGTHYYIATELGYNAIAVAQKTVTLNAMWGKIPSPKEKAHVGSDVKFFPTHRSKHVMIGYITEVFN